MADKIKKNSIELMLNKLYGKLGNLFTEQESMKQGQSIKEMCRGGRVRGRKKVRSIRKAQSGGRIGQYTPVSRDRMMSGYYQGFGGAKSGSDVLGSGLGWGSILGGLGSLAGSAWNLYQGAKPAEQLDPKDFYNPEYQRSKGLYTEGVSTMAKSKWSPHEAYRRADEATATAYGNVMNLGQGPGTTMSNLQAVRIGGGRDRSRIREEERRAGADYYNRLAGAQFTAAQGVGGLGQRRAATDLTIADYNQQAKAAQRAYAGTGFKGISDFSQMQQLMGGQRERDEGLASLYPEMFSISQYMPEFMQWINERKRR